MLSPNGSSQRSLSEKLLEDQKLMEKIQGILATRICSDNKVAYIRVQAGISVFAGSTSIDELAKRLNLRLVGASGDDLYWGTKQGSRQIFQSCEIPHPPGTPDPSVGDEDLLELGPKSKSAAYIDKTRGETWEDNQRFIRSPRALSIGLARQILLKGIRPRKWVVKLNQGFSGKGNAFLDLQSIQQNSPSYDEENYLNLPKSTKEAITSVANKIEGTLRFMEFEDPNLTWDGTGRDAGFRQQMKRLGTVAEAFVEGVQSSPSVQVVVDPDDKRTSEARVRVLSTHEQLLHGQVYEGCINPASSWYRLKIMEYGKKIGEHLVSRRIVGHFSADFLASEDSTSQSCVVNAVEINLRQGGTTHPASTVSILCGGGMDDDGVFRTRRGERRCYIATDTYEDERLLGMSSPELLDKVEDPSSSLPRWNPDTMEGVVFHLFRCLEVNGRIGFTAIASTLDKARIIYDKTIGFLDEVAKARISGQA